MLSMKSSTLPSVSWRSAISTATPLCCGTFARALRRIEEEQLRRVPALRGHQPQAAGGRAVDGILHRCQEIADRNQGDSAYLDELLVDAASIAIENERRYAGHDGAIGPEHRPELRHQGGQSVLRSSPPPAPALLRCRKHSGISRTGPNTSRHLLISTTSR